MLRHPSTKKTKKTKTKTKQNQTKSAKCDQRFLSMLPTNTNKTKQKTTHNAWPASYNSYTKVSPSKSKGRNK